MEIQRLLQTNNYHEIGKESRSRSLLGPVVAAAYKLGIPIRAQYMRDEDMEVMVRKTAFRIIFSTQILLTIGYAASIPRKL